MKFEVKERVVRIAENHAVIGDNADYTAEFMFDAEWDGVTKTARFMRDGKYVDKLLKDDKCDFPVEVLKRGKVTVGVYSAVMTTTGVSVVVAESVKEKTGNVSDPTPNVYEQLTGKLDAIQAELPEAVAEHFNEHKDELKGDKGDKGDKGEQGIQGIQGVQGEKGVVDYSLVANALKGKASGEVVRVDDVSPVEHNARVKVAGKNLFNINDTITKSDGIVFACSLEIGKIYTISSNKEIGWFKISDSVTGYNSIAKTYITSATFEMRRHAGIGEEKPQYIILGLTAGNSVTSIDELEGYNIQIEEGDTATEYTPYINPESVTVTAYGTDEANAKTYTPAADGTLEIPSISPSMTITADKAVNIDVEYNKDINAVINGILGKLAQI